MVPSQNGKRRAAKSIYSDPKYSYLEIKIYSTKERNPSGSYKLLGSSKAYINLQPITALYEHYTAGEGIGGPLRPSTDPGQNRIGPTPEADIPENFVTEDSQYILFVHGWRMQYWERVRFAETSLKRLYWQGYKGRFGFFSWPTDWFEKPAYWNEFMQVQAAARNAQNYSRSEALARRVGHDYLGPVIRKIQLDHGVSPRVFAHSMGNVVVSEAMRRAVTAAEGVLFHTYVTSQSAEAAGAYYSGLEDMLVDSKLCGVEPFQAAWRCLNNDNDHIADIPPDRYRYTLVSPYDPDMATWQQLHYYRGVRLQSVAGAIVNFHNQQDSALEAWRFQQASKPDAHTLGTDDPEWSFTFVEQPAPVGGVARVQDHYWMTPEGGQQTEINRLLSGGLNWQQTPGWPEIMAHIMPARTMALGHAPNAGAMGEISAGLNLNGGPYEFTASSFDHSAQFLSNNMRRQGYWEVLLLRFNLQAPRI